MDAIENDRQNRMPPPQLTINPNKTDAKNMFAEPLPNIGINKYTIDVHEQKAMTRRMMDVTMEKEIEAGLRDLGNMMNASTNRELCKELEGTYLHFHYPLCRFLNGH